MRVFSTFLKGLACAVSLWSGTAAHAATFQSIYSFLGGTGGEGPNGKLVEDGTAVLYGTTAGGGTAGRGTIFKFDPTSGVLTTLHSFANDMNGSEPEGGLILDSAGHLYGTTARSGLTDHCSLGCGTVFRLALGTGKLTTVYRFTGLADGSTPQASVLLLGGQLYGTTSYAGSGAGCPTQGCGTVFRLPLKTKALVTIRELTPADGVDPLAKLVRASNGLLYGTASAGGPLGSGTVFSVDPVTSAFAVVHGFAYHVDGSGLRCDLVIRNGHLDGTTQGGGPTAAGNGTIFTLDPSSGGLVSQYALTSSDGVDPAYGVAFGPDGLLYGATIQGGAFGAGTAFNFNSKTLVFTTIHAFTIADGSGPSGPLLAAKSGVLYGVTSGGGGGGAGTIFKIVP